MSGPGHQLRRARAAHGAWGPAGALAFALVVLAPSARADAPTREDRAAAVALFDEGRRLMAAGKHADACPKLAESQRLDPGIGTLFNLSACYEQVGKTASAWLGFRDVAAAASAAGQVDREKVARARVAALDNRLSRLQVVVPPEAASQGIEVKRDSAPLSQALWGTAIPLDPGEHVLSATAPSKKKWVMKVTLDKPGVVSINVPPLEPEAAASAVSAPRDTPPQAASPPVRPPAALPAAADSPSPPARGGGWLKPLGSTAIGLGVFGLCAGSVFGVLAWRTFEDTNSDGHCDSDGRCDADGLDSRDKAVLMGNVSTAAFIGGAVLTVGGAVLWLSAPSPSSSASARAPSRPVAALPIRIGVGPGALRIEGAF